MNEELFSLNQAARALECCVDTLLRYEKAGVVTFHRVAGRRVVSQADLDAIRSRRKALAEARRRAWVSIGSVGEPNA